MEIQQQQILDILTRIKKKPSESFESEFIEFKNYNSESSLHNSKDLAEEVSAIANHEGGVIIIGVKDSSEIKNNKWEEQLCGFEIVDLDLTRERITGRLKPFLKLSLKYIDFEEKHYLCIFIPKRIDSIISTSSGKVCIRDGKSSRPATPDEITELVKSLQFYDWSSEDVCTSYLDLIDIVATNEAIIEYCNRRELQVNEINVSSFLESIGATKNGILNKGGLLLFGKPDSIRRILGNYEYRFSWKLKNGELKINDVWMDCLWNTIKRTKNHFDSCNNKIKIEYNNENIEFFQLDEIAFHEAFLNALVHRDYSHSGMVTVNYTGQQLKITSPGNFYGGVNSNNIVYHEPRHRNKCLAHSLMLFQLVDRAGVGITRIGLHSLKYGRSFPVFTEKEDCIEVIMEAEYFRAGIFIINQRNPDFGIIELFILNSVFEYGFVLISELENKIRKITENPWDAIQRAMDVKAIKLYLEFKGTNKGVFICVKEVFKEVFSVRRTIKTTSTNSKHVLLYEYLKKFGSGSNDEITHILGHKHASQTSLFLKNSEYVKKGKNANSKWTLK
jgi:predicted HTH transcriptional regulator